MFVRRVRRRGPITQIIFDFVDDSALSSENSHSHASSSSSSSSSSSNSNSNSLSNLSRKLSPAVAEAYLTTAEGLVLRADGCAGFEESTCPISMTSFAATTQPLCVTPCGHVFLKSAILKWLREPRMTSPTCPSCRQPCLIFDLAPGSEHRVAFCYDQDEEQHNKQDAHGLSRTLDVVKEEVGGAAIRKVSRILAHIQLHPQAMHWLMDPCGIYRDSTRKQRVYDYDYDAEISSLSRFERLLDMKSLRMVMNQCEHTHILLHDMTWTVLDGMAQLSRACFSFAALCALPPPMEQRLARKHWRTAGLPSLLLQMKLKFERV